MAPKTTDNNKLCRYLRNLAAALLGREPHRKELDEVKEALSEAWEQVKELKAMYVKAVEQWCESNRLVTQMQEKLAKCEREKCSLQALTERLREHMSEQDALLGQLKKDWQRRMKEYNEEIDTLRGELQLAKRGKIL